MERRDYYAEIRYIAADAVDKILAGRLTDDLGDYLHETVDGHSFVIYTSQSLDVMRHSDNWLAAEEHGGMDAVRADDFSGTLVIYAYYAMLADVTRELESNFPAIADSTADLTDPDTLAGLLQKLTDYRSRPVGA